MEHAVFLKKLIVAQIVNKFSLTFKNRASCI